MIYLKNGKGTDHREVVLQDDVIKDFDAARFVVSREMGKDYPTMMDISYQTVLHMTNFKASDDIKITGKNTLTS
ncbi:hypothetical protein T4E_2955 [Trichinella pseudospiralis]|uniref:Uncharacterized protein n=1 Tax=Trichinella pseudospiralis TaxID=6337 RepID=A0A0V0XF85_TRIPS|nr:hypothetical protein T4E_2955 [Trichinella pseudospiralis]